MLFGQNWSEASLLKTSYRVTFPRKINEPTLACSLIFSAPDVKDEISWPAI
jgi:hypothetical protein